MRTARGLLITLLAGQSVAVLSSGGADAGNGGSGAEADKDKDGANKAKEGEEAPACVIQVRSDGADGGDTFSHEKCYIPPSEGKKCKVGGEAAVKAWTAMKDEAAKIQNPADATPEQARKKTLTDGSQGICCASHVQKALTACGKCTGFCTKCGTKPDQLCEKKEEGTPEGQKAGTKSNSFLEEPEQDSDGNYESV